MADGSEACAKAKRMKKPNFSPLEMEVLLHEVRLNRRLLFSNLTNSITNEKKKKKWESITEKVNAIGGNGRTIDQIKKRFKDAKKQFIDFKRESCKTGGGPPPHPVPYAEIIAEIIGENTCLANGIPGADEMIMVDEDEDCTSTPSSSFEKQSRSSPVTSFQSTSTSCFEPVRLLDWNSTLMEDLSVGTQVHDLVSATDQTPIKAVPQRPRPASTPPRLQAQKAVKSNKANKTKRKLSDMTCSSSSKKESLVGSEDDVWNEYLRSEIKKNEKKMELLDLQIQIAKSELAAKSGSARTAQPETL